jgi:hypothetical protein
MFKFWFFSQRILKNLKLILSACYSISSKNFILFVFSFATVESLSLSRSLLFSLSQRGCKGNNFNLTCKFYFALTKIIFSLSIYLFSYLPPVLWGCKGKKVNLWCKLFLYFIRTLSVFPLSLFSFSLSLRGCKTKDVLFTRKYILTLFLNLHILK